MVEFNILGGDTSPKLRQGEQLQVEVDRVASKSNEAALHSFVGKYSLQRGSPFTYEGVGRAADRLSGAIYKVSMGAAYRSV